MKLLALAAIFALVGCASGYRAGHWLQDGFSETRLGEGQWQVTFRGNGSTDEERAVDFALLRAAELCRRAGFAYFDLHDAYVDLERTEEEEEVTYTDEDGEEYSETETSVSEFPTAGHRVVCTQRLLDPERSLSSEYVESTIAGKYGL